MKKKRVTKNSMLRVRNRAKAFSFSHRRRAHRINRACNIKTLSNSAFLLGLSYSCIKDHCAKSNINLNSKVLALMSSEDRLSLERIRVS